MNIWHMDDDLVARYAAGSTDLVLAASVEAHLLKCATCRSSVKGAVSAQRLDDIWARVTDDLVAPPTLAERFRKWRRARPLSARFVIALAAAVAFSVVPSDLGPGHVPGVGPSLSAWTPTQSTAFVAAVTANDSGLAALTSGLTTVDGRLMSSYDPPPYRVRLEDAPHNSATVNERNVSGFDRSVIPRAAVVHSASGTWVYTINGTDAILRRRVTVYTENDGIAALSDGPAVGTKVLIFPIEPSAQRLPVPRNRGGFRYEV